MTKAIKRVTISHSVYPQGVEIEEASFGETNDRSSEAFVVTLLTCDELGLCQGKPVDLWLHTNSHIVINVTEIKEWQIVHIPFVKLANGVKGEADICSIVEKLFQ